MTAKEHGISTNHLRHYKWIEISYGCLKSCVGQRSHNPKTEHFYIHSNDAELPCSYPATDWIASQPKTAANIFAFQPSGITISSNHIGAVPGRMSLKAEKCTMLCSCQLYTHGLRLLLKDDVCLTNNILPEKTAFKKPNSNPHKRRRHRCYGEGEGNAVLTTQYTFPNRAFQPRQSAVLK